MATFVSYLMHPRIRFSISVILAVLFLWLFYRQSPGLNYGVFGFAVAVATFWLRRNEPRGLLYWCSTGLVMGLSFAVAWHGETWSFVMLGLSAFVLSGSAIVPLVPDVFASMKEAFANLFLAQQNFFSMRKGSVPGKRRFSVTRALMIYGIPFLIILLFLTFYRGSNPLFDGWIRTVLDKLGNLTDYLNLTAILVFLLGLFISNLYIQSLPDENAMKIWLQKPVNMVRKPFRRRYRREGLHRNLLVEYKAAMFLIVSLNVLLLLLNISDFKLVWLGFTWSGQLLKSFVHEGTWYLIASILIAAGTILFYFRGNLNFLARAEGLKWMVYLWLFQNFFLACSVAVRNYRYIEHYGLAYRRIGVIFFLLAILLGLIWVFLKVHRKEALQTLVSRLSVTGFAVLAVSGLPDWSGIITSYNLEHYKKSYVHMEFLAEMPDHVLPVLKKWEPMLGQIRIEQEQRKFRFSDTINGKTFSAVLQERIDRFRRDWPKKHWQEWSLEDSRAWWELQTLSEK
ncbi:MAG: DUF4173 domain-containing protein [Bacteroidetes bacterium]|nr:DUF4173 domain-containing protein [Bacteroidota bacterium]